MSETCCMWLAENRARKTVAKNRHLGTIAQLCRAISSQIRHVLTIGKNLLSSNTASTCPHNMANFGPLTAEIGWPVWGTPANFNGFASYSVTARHSSSGRQPNFVALDRGRHLYSAGRRSRWALAHISSYLFFRSSVRIQTLQNETGSKSHLEFPLSRHHLGIGASYFDAGVETSPIMSLQYVTTEHLVSADPTVVGT